MALGESEVIHINISTRKDDRYFLGTWSIFPVLEWHIHETIGNTLEEEFAVEYIHAVYAHLGIYLVLGGGKLAHLLHELLLTDIIYLGTREGI